MHRDSAVALARDARPTSAVDPASRWCCRCGFGARQPLSTAEPDRCLQDEPMGLVEGNAQRFSDLALGKHNLLYTSIVMAGSTSTLGLMAA